MSASCRRALRRSSAPCRRFESSRRHQLPLAVQEALPFLPLLLGPAHAPSLGDGVDDGHQGDEDHDRDPNEGQRHGSGGRDVEFMTAS
jgi:hypothetical protein